MAWTKTTVGLQNNVDRLYESYTLPSSATTEYSSVINIFSPKFSKENRYVTFVLNASAVSGTNLDIGLYGCDADGSNAVLLKDALVADITATGRVSAVVDLNTYPYPYYKVGWTSDADEDANTITVEVYG